MRFRSFLATLALAGAVACSDDRTPMAPDSQNLGDAQTPSTAQAAVNGPLVIPNVSGTLSDGGSFAGSLTLTQVTRNADGTILYASGTLTGVATLADNTTESVTQIFDATDLVTLLLDPQGSCRILELDLGPLNLDLLGLVVDLSAISLDVTAVAGPGNLLGNLLCAVAGLLDGSNLTALDRLLQQLNAILGGLLG